MKKYLIFDLGSSNCRAIVAKYDGNKFNTKIIHKFENGPVCVTGVLYWDILRLYNEIKKAIFIAVKKYKRIESIAIDSWGVDFSFISKEGYLISNPIHYRDKLRAKASEIAHKDFSRKELYEITGGFIIDIISIYNFYNFKYNRSSEFKIADKFLMISDLLNYFLTGSKINEFTNITTTVIYNQKDKKLSSKILNKLGVSEKLFPDIIQPGNRIGELQKSVRNELGIDNIPVVVPATHDTASAVAGIPVVEQRENWAFASMGTWVIQGVETKKPIINKGAFNAGYGNEGGCENRNLFVKNINGLWIIQQCMEKWRKEKGNSFSWNDIDMIYPKARPFYALIDVDDKSFIAPSSDMPNTIADYCKEKGQNIPLGIAKVSRCFYESLTLKIMYNIKQIEKIIGKQIEIMYLVGGGIKNKLICQWISDALNIPVMAGPVETTAVGNLLMQLKGDNEISNLDEGRRISRDSSIVTLYNPKEPDSWRNIYEYYLKIIINNK